MCRAQTRRTLGPLGRFPRTCAPVAQLDRVSVFGTEGYRFESCRAYSAFSKPLFSSSFVQAHFFHRTTCCRRPGPSMRLALVSIASRQLPDGSKVGCERIWMAHRIVRSQRCTDAAVEWRLREHTCVGWWYRRRARRWWKTSSSFRL